MKYISIGHGAYDITLPVLEFPKENTKIRVKSLIKCGGGPASNCAYLLGLWDCNSYFSGILGKDYYGEMIKNEFDQINVNTKYLKLSEDCKTSSSYIIANTSNGERTIITYRDDNLDNEKRIIDEHFDYILVDGDEYFLSDYILKNNKDALSIIDAGKYSDNILKLGKLVTYFICSKDFAEEFTHRKIDVKDRELLIEVYDMIAAYFNNKVIITLGYAGSFLKLDDYILVPSISVKAIDSSGAGDIFHGAFMYFITHNYTLFNSCYLANVAGALSTTKIGGRNSMPSLKEVLKYDNII